MPFGHDDGDGVAPLEAERPQAVRDLVGPCRQLAGGDLGAVGGDERDPVGVGGSLPEEAQFSHRRRLERVSVSALACPADGRTN